MASEEKMGLTRFPLDEAFKLVIENVSRRLARTALTVSGIVLSIAFYSTLMMTAKALSKLGEGGAISDYYIWMMILAFIVSAAGITNSVIMSVTERTQEIGTMKCLGALDIHIIELFLLESLIVGAIGGVLGFIIGIPASYILISYSFSSDVFFTLTIRDILRVMAGSILISIILSVVMSIYPTYKAAKLNPADALRFIV